MTQNEQDFLLKIDDHVFRVKTAYPYTFRKAKDYVVCDSALDEVGRNLGEPDCASITPEATFEITQADIDYESTQQPEEYDTSDEVLEFWALERALAEWGPTRGFFLMHGTIVKYGDKAYMFTAPSGTGKSTHANLWCETFKDKVCVLNGDKPFLRVINDSSVTVDDAPSGAADTSEGTATDRQEGSPEGPQVIAYGGPWAGKESWHTNDSAPLAGIVILHQAPSNSIEGVSPKDALLSLAQQIYYPKQTEAAIATLRLFGTLVTTVPIFSMGCTISTEAVRMSFEALTGERFPE